MRATVAALAPVLDLWVAGYRLPSIDDPTYAVEEADLEIIRDFFALLLVTAPVIPSSPLAAIRTHLPDFPEFPMHGLPSDGLVALGVARPSGPIVQLRQRLTEELDAEQAASYMALAGSL